MRIAATPSARLAPWLIPLALVAAACDDATTNPPEDLSVAATDAAADAGPPGDPYAYAPPTVTPIPEGLDPKTWLTHLDEDLLPYWRMEEAKGSPVGNFPTLRGMDGSVQPPGQRKPRMMGRQVFAYSVGFLLTGDEGLLDLARAGTRWILDHAEDKARGGFYADLDAQGAPYGDNEKWSQDLAYTVMGPAMYYFVTRDPEAEALVLRARDLLFDPAKYWDAQGGRIKDGLDGAMASERYMSAMGSWELVAQLDPVTAFLLLVQPVLSDEARRAQVKGDLRTLALRLRESFWRDGIFWGSTGKIGFYGSNHTDFGHILKAYWALLSIDKRLEDHPLREFLAANIGRTLQSAYDTPLGRWAKSPKSATEVNYGSDWWAYAEADQLAATLALHDADWVAKLALTTGHFRTDYVDRTRPARELVPSINRGGPWVYPWKDPDTAKCNVWKNGFHSTEHALVLFLFAHWLAGSEAPLHFALPRDKVMAAAQATQPYTFLGTVAGVDDLRPLAADAGRRVVRVRFRELH